MKEIALRASKRGEEEVLGRTGWEAFRFGQPEYWTTYYRTHAHRKPEDTLVATIGGAVAGHATALRFEMGLAGARVPMRGIAAVAVVPEVRRRGVAHRLMRALIERMRERGEALTLLYPFDAGFYNRMGYGTIEWQERVRVPTRLLPPSTLRQHVRRLDRARDLAAVRRVYDTARAGETGPIDRTPWWWESRIFTRIPDSVAYVSPDTKKLEGYLLYELPDEPKHPRQHFLVKELAATTPDAFRGLVGFIESLGEQLALVELDAAPGHALPLLASHPEDAALNIVPGAMGRLVDVPRAFALHPAIAAARGTFGLDVADPIFGEASYDVSLPSVRDGRRARERLTLGIDRLSQVYFRGASASVLLRQGLIAGSATAAALLDAACVGPPTYLRLPNHF